ncbi:MAG TPA: histidine kinase, partial [Glaciihabitans sp.]|nr:histidine kinase [Glaciihabitans sp.]
FDEVGRYGAFLFLDLLFGVVALVLLPFRRRKPLLIAVLAAAISSVSALGFGAVTIIVISLATRRKVAEIAIVSSVMMVAVAASSVDPRSAYGAPTSIIVVLAVGAGYLAICILIGLYIGGRRELLISLHERAKLAETEQAARLEQARASERTTIAREMHDVLAHRLSLVALHSGALTYRDDLTREETASTAGIVRDNAHLALTELREVLGVLRDTTATAVAAPQPTLTALPELLEQSRLAGTAVTNQIDPAIAEAIPTLPESTSRHAFRIIQESLTNARRHAAGAPVELSITGDIGERLVIQISNPHTETMLPPTEAADPSEATHTMALSSGLGLPGLEERARLAGGTLVYGVEGDQFVVKAWLPWTP